MDNNNIVTLSNENTELRKQIKEVIESIQNCMEQTSPFSSFQNNELCLNNILDDLPVPQQISLYQDSIIELKKQLKHKNILQIEHLENKIRGKFEIIYNLKNYNNEIKKLYDQQNRLHNDPLQKEGKNQIKFLNQKVNQAKGDYKDLKLLSKEIQDTLKEQNNAIYTLEDNCLFIRENIEYKKKHNNESDEVSNSFTLDELEMKGQQMEMNARKQEEWYKRELIKQEEHIESLSNQLNTLNYQMIQINHEEYMNRSKTQVKNNQTLTMKIVNHKNEMIDTADNNLLLSSFIHNNSKLLSDTQKLFERIDKSDLLE